ncbi:MAG TPA: DMT family transporter [Candidatus Binatus sp.]|nr:DMT family transporter [Candidatus Binatus sp.]
MRFDTGLVATVTAGILFGTSIPLIKLGLDHSIPPLSFASLRFLLASLLIIALFRGKGWVDKSLLFSQKMWIVGLLNMLGYVLQFEGQSLATGSEAALIIGTAALMIPLIAWSRRQEEFRLLKAVGVIIGFLGISLLVLGETAASNPGQSHFIGELLLGATAVTIALVFIYSKSLAVKHGDRAVTGGIVLTSTLLLLPFAPLGQTIQTVLDPLMWLYIIALAIFGTVGAYYFFSRSLEHVSPIVSSTILPIEVVVSTLLSVLVFNDAFTILSGAGAVLTLIGVALVSMTR